jgi:hypothetical protein
MISLLTERGRALAAKAEPSRPSHRSQVSDIKGPPPVHNVLHSRLFVRTGKPPIGHPSDLPPLTVDRTAQPLPLPLRRSRSFLELRCCFPNQEGDIFPAVGLQRRRPRR